MKHGFKEEVMAADAATPEAQPNVEQATKESLEPVEDPMDFYINGWFSKIRPLFRRTVDRSEIERVLNFDLKKQSQDQTKDLYKFCLICSALMKTSLYFDSNPERCDVILSKACQAAEVFPKEFAKAMDLCFPWIFNCNRFPSFEIEKKFIEIGRPVLSQNEGPVEHLVWIHTLRLLHDKEPLKSLNIDFAAIEEVERRVKTYDLVEYYRFLHKNDPEEWPPYYLTQYWREQGIEVDFVPHWK